MRVLATAILVLAFLASGAGATFTVYQGSPNSGKVLGTFDTRKEAGAFARHHPGLGESIVNDTTGKTVKEPGRVINGQGGTRNNLKHQN